jgi:hypothetical protein
MPLRVGLTPSLDTASPVWRIVGPQGGGPTPATKSKEASMHTVFPITPEEIQEMFFDEALSAHDEFPTIRASVLLIATSDERFGRLEEALGLWTYEPLYSYSCCFWSSPQRYSAVVYHGYEIYLFGFADPASFANGLVAIRAHFRRGHR